MNQSLSRVKMNIEEMVKNNYPFLIVALLVFLTAMQVSVVRDDLEFLAMSEGYSLIEFWIYRYSTWSARNIIEMALVFMAHSKNLWAFVTSCFIVVMCHSFAVILNITEPKRKWIAALLVCAYPMISMSGAGWIATTTNYLWVGALGIYACTCIVRVARDEPIHWYHVILYTLATLYAANQEQCATILTIIFGCAILYLGYQRKCVKYLVILCFLSIGAVVYHLTAVGNTIRKVQETAIHLPEFEYWSTLDKIKAGFLTSMYHFVVAPNRILFLLTLLLIIGLCFRYKGIKKYGLIIPLISTSVWGVIYYFFLEDTTLVKLICYVHFLIILVIIPIAIYFIMQNKMKALLCTGLLGIGLLSRMILGFSPTINASGVRTYLFMYLTILLVIGLVYMEIVPLVSKKISKLIHLSIFLVAAYSFLEYLYGVFTII